VEKGSVMASRRDIPGRDGKSFLPQENIEVSVKSLLDAIHTNLYEKAKAFRDSNIHDPADYEEMKEVLQGGWSFSWWCGDPVCEAKVKEDTKATTRCIPDEQPGGKGKCIVCGRDATEKVHFSRAY
jgi:prolyl-tRNA synthetase